MQHKLAISVACSVGLHALLLLYWHNSQTHSRHELVTLESHTDGISEPVHLVLRPNPQRHVESEEIRDNVSSPVNESAVLPSPPVEVSATPSEVIAPPIENSEDRDIMPEVTSQENLLTIEPARAQNDASFVVPDRLSIQDQIQQFAPQTQGSGPASVACQQIKRIRGMPVACQPERYAATMTEEENSLSVQVQERLASLLDGPEPITAASDDDISDTGNRVQANRNLVGDQLQANQVRNSVMNQP